MRLKDVIHELRKGIPDREKTVKSLRSKGLFLLIISLVNLTALFNPNENFNSIWHKYMIAALFISGLFLVISAYGVKRRTGWGEILGQFGAVFALIGLCFAPLFFYDVVPVDFMRIPFVIFTCIIMLDFIIPAALSVGYLQRLKKQRAYNWQ
ncbi:MAG: hypothetical protein GY795_21545 [Desulfobacterales bacterium]|nr:hypothetical protein [Desulfobacterales bacterium]